MAMPTLADQPKDVIADTTGCREGGKNLPGDQGGIRWLRDVARQHQKFVSAVAADGVRGAHDRLQAACHLLQHCIADRMSE